MAQVTTLGIDIAKNVVFVHGVDTHGHVVVTKRLARQKVLPFIAQLPPCLIGMEASGGAHYTYFISQRNFFGCKQLRLL